MRISIVLEALTGAFETDMARASRTAQKRLREVEKTSIAAGKVIGAALAAGAAAAVLAIDKAIDKADLLDQMSQKVGIPADVLSGLNYAANQADVATEQLQAGLQKLIKFQADAAQGGKESLRVFQTLGIAVKDAAGNLRNADAVFGDFAQVFAALEDGPAKTALALQVFGKAGADLIPLLNEGRGGIAAYAEELQRLGGQVSPQTAAAAGKFNDNLDKLATAAGALALKVAEQLLPTMIELTDELVRFAKEGSTATSIADFIKNDLEELSGTFRHVTIEIEELKKAWSEQGLFGEGIFSVLKRAQDRFEEENKQREQRRLDRAIGFGGPTQRGTAAKGRAQGIADREAREAAEAANRLFSPQSSGKALSEAEREAKRLQETFDRLLAQQAESIALYGQTSEVAKTRYAIEHGDLVDLTAAQKEQLLAQARTLDTLAAEKALLDERNKAAAEELRIREESLEGLDDLLSDMQFELDLLGKTNAERVVANELRRVGIGLTEEERKAAEEAIRTKALEIEAAHKQIDALDEFRQNFEDNLAAVLDGSKSIGDAFKDMADAIIAQIARMIAEQWTQQLFGQMGTTQTGSAGGWISSLLGSFLGGGTGGFANGTTSAPGGMAWVGELGPEKVYLPKGSAVVPNHKTERGGGTRITNINVGVEGQVDRRTRQHIAQEVRAAVAFSARAD